MKTYRISYAIIAIVCLSACIGCGEKTVAVSGKVMLNGKPVKDCQVMFEPLRENSTLGPRAIGITDADGQYTLASVETEKEGVAVGKCRIRLAWEDPEPSTEYGAPSKQPPYQLPKKASDGSMTYDVPSGGTDKADFAFP